ncbi:Gfo/Idh/MocA family protein, partial [Agromyces aerolatus]|uniref:Gfo/Idh/MocA family protein n=1 Tax=Agromyces sp. LY-1074 TaxID=3074080 RepID=UPI00285BF3D2
YLQDWLATPHDDDWRVDTAQGGPSRAFADIGSHLVDLLEFTTGDRVVRLNARTRTVFGARATNTDIATEDLVAVVVELAGGAIGTLLVSQVAPGHKNGLVLELGGTEASVRFEQERPETLWVGRTSTSSVVERDPARLSPDAARLSLVPPGHPMGYQDAFNAFVADTYATISGARPEGLPTFDDGLRAVRVTEAVLASATTGEWTEVAA